MREKSYTNRIGLFFLIKRLWLLHLVRLTLAPQLLAFVAQRNCHCRTSCLSRTAQV